MDKMTEELYQERLKRVEDAIQLKVPDRVPIVTSFGYFPAKYNGITCKDAFEKSLDVEPVKAIIGKLETRQVALTMPKFEYESSFGLKQALSTLGMGVAFTPDADFSGMNGERDLLIQDVLHKAFVSVDEAGTEAAAATAVIVGVTSIPAQPVEVKIDRPFIFLIRDIPTGSIIFVGRVLDPAAK